MLPEQVIDELVAHPETFLAIYDIIFADGECGADLEQPDSTRSTSENKSTV